MDVVSISGQNYSGDENYINGGFGVRGGRSEAPQYDA
jgi:hypothetical protein